MDNYSMIEKLKKAGVKFSQGLSNDEISKIEDTFGFRFPKEIASFLSCEFPIGSGFFNYRDMSAQNILAFNKFQEKIKGAFLFDIERNTESVKAMLKDAVGLYSDQDEFKNAVMAALEKSPKLIPFCAHRCFFDGMDDMPIVSFWQAVDTIFYGSDLENYLEHEFLCPDSYHIGTISDKFKDTGIWHYIIL